MGMKFPWHLFCNFFLGIFWWWICCTESILVRNFPKTATWGKRWIFLLGSVSWHQKGQFFRLLFLGWNGLHDQKSTTNTSKFHRWSRNILVFGFSRSLHEILPIQCTPVLLYLPFTRNSSPFKTSMEILDPAMNGILFRGGGDLNNGGSPFHVPNGSVQGKPQSSRTSTDLNGRDLPLGKAIKGLPQLNVGHRRFQRKKKHHRGGPGQVRCEMLTTRGIFWGY